MVRMHNPLLREIDGWVGKSGISRPEAIRQLVTWALQHTKPTVPTNSIVKRTQGDERRL